VYSCQKSKGAGPGGAGGGNMGETPPAPLVLLSERVNEHGCEQHHYDAEHGDRCDEGHCVFSCAVGQRPRAWHMHSARLVWLVADR